MAVAGDQASRFGSADSEIRINKPVTLKATFPRFLAVGDKASFGAVVTSQLKTAGHGDGDDREPRSGRACSSPATAAQTRATWRPADRSKSASTPPAGRSAARACR